ncbi:A24 family peptidase [Clostridiaceae bacterium HSG29]|nr:A24 family peptidase [Clostridiaceae bacterium HSG29]
MYIKLVFVFLFILSAAINDIKYSKISNKLILISIIFGLSYNVYLNNFAGFIFSIKGIILPFIALYVLFLMNFLPAGDIKLFMAIGSVLGYQYVFMIIIISVFIGGIYSIFLLIKNRKFSDFKKLFVYFKSCVLNMKLLEYNVSESIRFPFAPIVFISYLAFIFVKNMI